MKVRIGAILCALCAAAIPSLAHAQQDQTNQFTDSSTALVARQLARSATPVKIESQAQEQEPKPEEQMSTSGFFLGIIGMLAGAAIGSQIGQGECPSRQVDKECVGRHAYTGALVAGTVLVPIGVHLASKHRGNLFVSLGLSAATGAGLYYGFKAIPGSPIAMAPFVAAPIQVLTSVKLQRK